MDNLAHLALVNSDALAASISRTAFVEARLGMCNTRTTGGFTGGGISRSTNGHISTGGVTASGGAEACCLMSPQSVSPTQILAEVKVGLIE